MSDSIKKWEEMQEGNSMEMVSKRGISDNEQVKKDAFSILTIYSEESIKMAAKILQTVGA